MLQMTSGLNFEFFAGPLKREGLNQLYYYYQFLPLLKRCFQIMKEGMDHINMIVTDFSVG